MTAREIIRKQYGQSRNPLSSRVLGYGRLAFGAYELSEGRGMVSGLLIGVTVVELLADGSTRPLRLSRCFQGPQAKDQARRFIECLRRMTRPPLERDEAWEEAHLMETSPSRLTAATMDAVRLGADVR